MPCLLSQNSLPTTHVGGRNRFRQELFFAFGLAVNSPYGLGFDWGETSFAKLDVYKANLTLFNIQPSIAFLFTEKFSIGVGMNFYVGKLDFKNKIDVAFLQGLLK